MFCDVNNQNYSKTPLKLVALHRCAVAVTNLAHYVVFHIENYTSGFIRVVLKVHFVRHTQLQQRQAFTSKFIWDY